jgi:hypothetical protein
MNISCQEWFTISQAAIGVPNAGPILPPMEKMPRAVPFRVSGKLFAR